MDRPVDSLHSFAWNHDMVMPAQKEYLRTFNYYEVVLELRRFVQCKLFFIRIVKSDTLERGEYVIVCILCSNDIMLGLI